MRKMWMALLVVAALALGAPGQAKGQWLGRGGWYGFRPSWQGYWGATRSYWRYTQPSVYGYWEFYAVPSAYGWPDRYQLSRQRSRSGQAGAAWSRLSQHRQVGSR